MKQELLDRIGRGILIASVEQTARDHLDLDFGRALDDRKNARVARLREIPYSSAKPLSPPAKPCKFVQALSFFADSASIRLPTAPF